MYEKTIKLPLDGWSVEGDLVLPVKVDSIIIFSGGSCRYNSHTNAIAKNLQKSGFGTLLFNLMTEQEAEDFGKNLSIGQLTQRLLAFTIWIRSHSEYHKLELGYFCFNIGAAAALRAVSEIQSAIKAVVTESARIDLAADKLTDIVTPTMLIVGELDFQNLKRSREAFDVLTCDKRLVVIPGGSHSLDEPGKLSMESRDATSWFSKYMSISSRSREIVFEEPGNRD
ncbi:MAG: hypothetical protein R3281_13580 [Balneolaceae bacterium]|nr:hypothetical protein [Balneolaceae bacterium]